MDNRAMKRFGIFTALLLLSAALSLVGCQKPGKRLLAIPDEAKYFVVYSDMFESTAGGFYLDERGGIVGGRESFGLQDISCYDVSKNGIVLSGERRNNTLLLSRGSAVANAEFLFLNEGSYSGVTAITQRGGELIGIMNGNAMEDSYHTLLVRQPVGGNELVKTELDIFAWTVIDDGGSALVAGTYLPTGSSEYSARLMECSLAESKVLRARNYKEYAEFWHGVLVNQDWMLRAECWDQTSALVLIDRETLNVRAELKLGDRPERLCGADGRIFAVGDRGIYEIDPELASFTKRVDFTGGANEDEAYTDYSNCAYLMDGRIYVFLRYDKVGREGKLYHYGQILEVDIESWEVSKTPLSYTRRDDVTHLFPVPVTFFK